MTVSHLGFNHMAGHPIAVDLFAGQAASVLGFNSGTNIESCQLKPKTEAACPSKQIDRYRMSCHVIET